jgi:DNA-binding response OmpR family regulator
MANSVLIVEGSGQYRAFLLDFFKTRDIFAFGCAAYAEAEQCTVGKRFDVAIVDYFIGSESARLFCSRLNVRYQHETALVIMSDAHSPEIELEIRGLAPDFYFVKPFLVDNLYAVVLKLFESRDKKVLMRQKMLYRC